MLRKPTALRVQPGRLTVVDTRRIKPPAKQTNPYYLSPEHRQWRQVIIARSGGFCQDLHCPTPQRRPSRLFADHIVELRDGGAPTDPANGIALCGACHSRKTAAERAKRMRS